ncbi:ankyrin repeat domain-containing protein [Massilia sp. PWRC2]|uniref:ankyrin repeat domain-containing protein n=1 Tax=Massilia sp. PWRC2 TaxID=2804626 RepID=UPI003CE7D198
MRIISIKLLLAGALAAPLASSAAAPERDQLTRYFRSLQMDDAKTVVRMVNERQVNPNQADPRSGESGLIVALREGASTVASALVAMPGLDLEATAPNGNTALMMAAFKHNLPLVRALLAKGAQVNRPGWNALHFAAAAGDDAITGLLLSHGAAIDARAPAGFTALMLAAREGQTSTVAVLLEAGADAALTNSEQLSAAQIAARAEQPAIAAAIDAFGARQRRQ